MIFRDFRVFRTTINARDQLSLQNDKIESRKTI